MRALLLLALVGCREGDGALYPINPGGGGGGGGMHGGVDAATDGNGSGGQLTGRVCLISDARNPTTGCATTGADGLTVALDGAMTTTAADGTFMIDPPTGTNVQWQVTGSDLITSIMGYSSSRTIPAMTDVAYLDLTSDNSVIASSGKGDVFVRITRGGAPLEQVAASAMPLADYATLYDGNAPTTWTQLGTGPLGMVWIPGLAQGAATVTLTPFGEAATALPAIPIGDQTLTWVSASLP